MAEGNPIRCIRRSLLTQSTADLKKYLKTRGPPAGIGPGSVPAISGIKESAAAAAAAATAGGEGTDRQIGSFDPDEQAYSTDNEYDFRIRSMTAGVLDLSKMGVARLPMSFLHKLQTSHAFDCSTESLSLLTSLNTSDNKLTSVPYDIIDRLPALKVLVCCGNKLGAAGADDGRIGRLPTSLRCLDISKNRVTASLLAAIVDCCHLSDLNAAKNSLDSIPASIAQLTGLRELQLANNQIVSISNVSFASLLSLEVLGLR